MTGGGMVRGGRRRTRLTGGLVLVLLGTGIPPVAAQRFCPSVQPGPGRRWATTSNCCSQLSPPLACNTVSPALQGGRRNAIVVVEDDFGHCMSGFMGGRCARRGSRCMGKTCANARWLSCESTADCPDAGPPTGCGPSPSACTAEVANECPAGTPCTHGYCRQCTSDAQCAPDICVDGLCSPRASCDGAFECARGVGTCQAGTCVESGGPCAA